ncbi:MAG TPA: pyrroline-5-carboxylate reductase [Dongiaceae bacterium]|nr:pyrroline-5-carboxylate reductase [Dongiaceae bacterium]
MSDQKIVLPGPLLLVGCGKMGGALLRGWLKRGIPGKDVFVVDPAPRGLEDVQGRGVTLVTAAGQLPPALQPGIVLLAIKPQFMDEALPAYRRFAKPGTVFLSIAAGRTVMYLKGKLGADAQIVRSMPNTPAEVGRGMSVILKDAGIPAATLDLCGQLLSAVGKVGWIDEEDQINAVTAVSGGGPAYVFLLIECLAEAARAAGLPEDLAMQLARETVVGSGELAHRSAESATQLRQAVMSPKGTTIEALAVLMGPEGWQPLITKAIAAATRRGREIAEGR